MKNVGPSPVTLYTYALSPFGMKVFWALVYKDIDFELVYVNPRDQNQIAFTKQRIIPVLSVGDAWKMDSRQICIWLDKLFPDKLISGKDAERRAAIAQTDQWVTDNLIALGFRSVIDREESRNTYYNGRILGRTMRKTSGAIPIGIEFIWPYFLRKRKFIQRDAAKIDPNKSLRFHRKDILNQLEARLEGTGFIANTETPSIADLSAYAFLVSGLTFGFRGGIDTLSSSIVSNWMKRMQANMPVDPKPALVPDWTPYRL